MSSLTLGLIPYGDSGTGVYNDGLLDDKSIAVKARDVTARIGKRDLVDLIGVKPDFLLSALEHGCGKTLLEFEGYWKMNIDE